MEPSQQQTAYHGDCNVNNMLPLERVIDFSGLTISSLYAKNKSNSFFLSRVQYQDFCLWMEVEFGSSQTTLILSFKSTVWEHDNRRQHKQSKCIPSLPRVDFSKDWSVIRASLGMPLTFKWLRPNGLSVKRNSHVCGLAEFPVVP